MKENNQTSKYTVRQTALLKIIDRLRKLVVDYPQIYAEIDETDPDNSDYYRLTFCLPSRVVFDEKKEFDKQ